MDGSTIVIPSATAPSGLAREDALFRIVYYGEALRAITEHVNDTLIAGACGPMIEMLDEAFDTMSETRDTFGPEEFTLFVMSRMLGRCDTPDAAREFQVGAASYILKSADALPEAYQPVIADARRMLGKPDADTPPAPTREALPETPPDTPPMVQCEAGSDTAETRAETRQTVRHQRVVETPARIQQVAQPVPSESRPAQHQNYVDPAYRPRRRFRSVARRAWKRFRRVLTWTLVTAGFAVVGLIAMGALDPVDLLRSIVDVVSRALR